MSIIEVKNISKKYKDSYVLVDVSFSVEENEFLCILGPSGSGKSTLLHSISGIVSPDQGDILFNNRSILGVAPSKRDFGVVFQGLHLFDHLNVTDNIAFSLKTERHRKSKEFITDRVSFLIELLRLQGLEKRYPNQLSGGEQQRVAIARAIAFEPRILLLDEPFSALDKILQESLMYELKKLQLKLGLVIIYITHNQTECAILADRVLILNKGKTQQIGTYNSIYSSPINRFVLEFIGESNFFTGQIVNESPGSFSVKLPNNSIIQVEKKSGFCIGEYIDVFVRTEKTTTKTSNDGNEIRFTGRIMQCTKMSYKYRVSLVIDDIFIWHFYSDDELSKDSIVSIFFQIKYIYYYKNNAL